MFQDDLLGCEDCFLLLVADAGYGETVLLGRSYTKGASTEELD